MLTTLLLEQNPKSTEIDYYFDPKLLSGQSIFEAGRIQNRISEHGAWDFVVYASENCGF